MALKPFLHKKKPKKYKRTEEEIIVKQRKPKLAKKPKRKKRDPFYNSYEWKKIRLEVLSEGDNRCALCGRTKFDLRDDNTKVCLTVDHIISRSIDPSKELDKSNLQILCSDCHEAKMVDDDRDFRMKEETVIDYNADDYQELLIMEVFGNEK